MSHSSQHSLDTFIHSLNGNDPTRWLGDWIRDLGIENEFRLNSSTGSTTLTVKLDEQHQLYRSISLDTEELRLFQFHFPGSTFFLTYLLYHNYLSSLSLDSEFFTTLYDNLTRLANHGYHYLPFLEFIRSQSDILANERRYPHRMVFYNGMPREVIFEVSGENVIPDRFAPDNAPIFRFLQALRGFLGMGTTNRVMRMSVMGRLTFNVNDIISTEDRFVPPPAYVGRGYIQSTAPITFDEVRRDDRLDALRSLSINLRGSVTPSFQDIAKFVQKHKPKHKTIKTQFLQGVKLFE